MTIGEKIDKLVADLTREDGRGLAEFILSEALLKLCLGGKFRKEPGIWDSLVVERRDRGMIVERHAPSHYCCRDLSANDQNVIADAEEAEMVEQAG